jgi:hypothetical protein
MLQKVKQFVGLMFLCCLALLGFWSTNIEIGPAMVNGREEENKIFDVIDKYFQFRYKAYSSLQSTDLNDYLSNNVNSKGFHKAELDKVDIELYSLKSNGLTY